MHTPIHVAPGLGFLLPGWFSVPQNPITGARQVTSYTPHMAEILPGSLPVSSGNAVSRSVKAMSGGGCHCGGTCGGCNGLGALSDATLDFDLGSIMDGTAGWPTYIVVLGGIGLLSGVLFSRGPDYRAEISRVRGKYKRRATRLAEAF